jgi:hypothetical protein
MRKRRDDSIRLSRNENKILDEKEQDEIVKELKATAQRQAQNGRNIFVILFSIISIGFTTIFARSFVEPWELSHQSAFKDLMPFQVFQCFYICSVGNFYILAGIVKVLKLYLSHAHVKFSVL